MAHSVNPVKGLRAGFARGAGRTSPTLWARVSEAEVFGWSLAAPIRVSAFGVADVRERQTLR